jgi:hypothetical protein
VCTFSIEDNLASLLISRSNDVTTEVVTSAVPVLEHLPEVLPISTAPVKVKLSLCFN